MQENFENIQPGDQEMEERLWNLIDGTATPEEKQGMEELIATNAAWKSRYHELLGLNELLQSSELHEPSMRFTKNVMEEIGKLQIAPATRNYINKRIVWGIGIFFITLIIGFIVYSIGQIDWSTSGSSETKLPVELDKIDYSRIFNNSFVNIFMMVNVVLGLFLLDRYLSNKKRRAH